jgi:hypothetical protein
MADNPSNASPKSSLNGAPPKFVHQDVSKLGIASALLKASASPLLVYPIYRLTCPSRRRNRSSVRLSLQRRQRRKYLLQRRRSRPLPHAPRQPQPRPRPLHIKYHMHARIQPTLHSAQDHAVDHHPAQRHASTLARQQGCPESTRVSSRRRLRAALHARTRSVAGRSAEEPRI